MVLFVFPADLPIYMPIDVVLKDVIGRLVVIPAAISTPFI